VPGLLTHRAPRTLPGTRPSGRLPRGCRSNLRLCSGLTRCGICGGGYTIKNNDRLACSSHRERGSAENGQAIRLPTPCRPAPFPSPS
jgi:hypothetical protein